MKVILLSDLKALGKRGDVVEVAEGYARNYLLPRALAAEASKGALTVLAEQQRAKEKRAAQSLAEAKSLAQRLESMPVSVSAKCGANGRLFGTVTSAQIADAIERAFSVNIDRHKIGLKDAIKSLGSYAIEIKLGQNVVAKTTVNVVAS
ncbi:MAG: 50S ribosomal protein L9 [Candidatus Eremiobacteraeota bacterium]|nr:50S ribosomal protein L9 [Candidatus Eremiobacteraeota bacterium]MBV9737887.1 50S ribosomal protein L9 [Candidatus Eremiobacteraeota bacterium]